MHGLGHTLERILHVTEHHDRGWSAKHLLLAVCRRGEPRLEVVVLDDDEAPRLNVVRGRCAPREVQKLSQVRLGDRRRGVLADGAPRQRRLGGGDSSDSVQPFFIRYALHTLRIRIL